MRLHGSVIPRMIVPLFWIACWSTLITCISMFSGTKLAVNTLLLTVLGFVISLALSFKSTTAYERFVSPSSPYPSKLYRYTSLEYESKPN